MRKDLRVADVTSDQATKIRAAAYATWEEIGYEVLGALAEEGNDSIPRAEVIELVLDAGRIDQTLKRMYGQKQADELVKILDQMPYDQQVRLVQPIFSFARYGL